LDLPNIPGYTIVEKLGEGAMANVFLAVQDNLNRKVALKIMTQSLAHDPQFRDRFLAEAEDTAKFIHPGIVTIYNTDVFEDNYFLVLEYLEAGTLKDRQRTRIKERKAKGESTDLLFSAEETLQLMEELADALGYAHSKNVVHRDLKPANIMFRSNGGAVLSDFGIAKSVTENRELTMTGFSVGTPAYMSPEQKLGADIDGRSDLYSLGVVFFELLTGQKPFHSRTGNYSDLRKELDADVPQLPEQLTWLQPMLSKLLAKDPADRYQTAEDLLRAVRELTGVSSSPGGDETVLQQRVGTAGSQAAGDKKSWLKTGLIVSVIAVVLAVAAVAVMKFMPQPEPVIEVQPVTAEVAAEIESLLKKADFFSEFGPQLNHGPSNAVAGYQRVLNLQPGNPLALKGLETTLTKILVEIESFKQAGDQESAQNLVELALQHFPDNKDLVELRENVTF